MRKKVESSISVHNLFVKYHNNLVIKDASFDILRGSITYLVGRNGSGKSTLIKAIIGLIEKESGHIFINGERRTQREIAQFVGYLPQYTEIDRSFPITVEEMIELECANKGHCPLGVEGHLKKLDGGMLSKHSLNELSGGELQKVLIARSLVTDPEILILDEPMNNLDHKSQDKLLLMLHEMNDKGTTVVVVTHDYDLIDRNSGSVLLIDDGEVIEGQLEQLLEERGVRYEHH